MTKKSVIDWMYTICGYDMVGFVYLFNLSSYPVFFSTDLTTKTVPCLVATTWPTVLPTCTSSWENLHSKGMFPEKQEYLQCTKMSMF